MPSNTVSQETQEQEKTTITTSITVDADLWREAKKTAIDRRISTQALLEEALRSHLKIGQEK